MQYAAPAAKRAFLAIAALAVVVGVVSAVDVQRSVRPPSDAVFARGEFLQPYYEEAFDWAAKHPAPPSDPGSLVVNHHLLAKHLIARTLLSVQRTPQRIVLIGPDHFERGAMDATVATADHDTVYGRVTADAAFAEALELDRAAYQGNRQMASEHAISNLAPFLEKLWPDARVLSVMVKPDLEDVSGLAEAIGSRLRPDDLVIASIDFSHYLTGPATDFHDRMATAVMQNGDAERAALLDVDCRSCVKLLFALNARRGTEKFVIHDNTDAAKLIGYDKVVESTSYVNGAYVKGEPEHTGRYTVLLTPLVADGNVTKAFGDILRSEIDERLSYGQYHTSGLNPNGEHSESCAERLKVVLKEGTGITMRHTLLGGRPFVEFTAPAVRPEKLPERTLAVGISCEEDHSRIYPFLLERVNARLQLVPYAEARAYLHQNFGMTEDFLTIR